MLNSKTRLKLTFIAGLFLSALAVLATSMKMEVVATTAIAGIMTILSTYIRSQTNLPSQNENPNADTAEK